MNHDLRGLRSLPLRTWLVLVLPLVLSALDGSGRAAAADEAGRADGYRGDPWFTLGQSRTRRQVLRRARHLHVQP